MVVYQGRCPILARASIREPSAVLVPCPDLQVWPTIPPLEVQVDQRECECQQRDRYRTELCQALLAHILPCPPPAPSTSPEERTRCRHRPGGRHPRPDQGFSQVPYILNEEGES